MEDGARSRLTEEILNIVRQLRALGNGECADSTLYLTPDGHYAMGMPFFSEDTQPREIKTGAYRQIVSLHGLPPRRVARFLKLNRWELGVIGEKLLAGGKRNEEEARLYLISLASFSESWRQRAIASPSSPPPVGRR